MHRLAINSTFVAARVIALGLLSVACRDEQPDASFATTAPPFSAAHTQANGPGLDQVLSAVLSAHGFTGRVGSSLTERLGRPLNADLADIGRLLWFDPILGLKGDNSCSGCHSPTDGFGDTQSIAIGIDNNGMVGPGRAGPRNQRRSPMVLNAAFFPRLMWNSRFAAVSGDPFDGSDGFQFPAPEAMSLSYLPHLLNAQAFVPPTERVEMAGFDFVGGNADVRAEVVRRVAAVEAYMSRFGAALPAVASSGSLAYDDIAAAIAEFTFSLTFADAPVDRFARGETGALTEHQKLGALLFFGRAQCVQCHSVGGASNEMFSDFRQHVIAVLQIAPSVGNVAFDGPGGDEDFGLEQVTGKARDRYAFRTSPLRNVALQPTFMHSGAFTSLEDAIRHHLDPRASALGYSGAGLATDLSGRGPMQAVLDRLDPKLRSSVTLDDTELGQLVDFVRNGLLDPRARPGALRSLVPSTLPSGKSPHVFQFE
jgi:cytochrome c peroxidase